MSQKYFSGTPGTESREYSIKQLVGRVADTITRHGIKEGYFADKEEAETFNQELKYVLTSQRAAFNCQCGLTLVRQNELSRPAPVLFWLLKTLCHRFLTGTLKRDDL